METKVSAGELSIWSISRTLVSGLDWLVFVCKWTRRPIEEVLRQQKRRTTDLLVEILDDSTVKKESFSPAPGLSCHSENVPKSWSRGSKMFITLIYKKEIPLVTFIVDIF